MQPNFRSSKKCDAQIVGLHASYRQANLLVKPAVVRIEIHFAIYAQLYLFVILYETSWNFVIMHICMFGYENYSSDKNLESK